MIAFPALPRMGAGKITVSGLLTKTATHLTLATRRLGTAAVEYGVESVDSDHEFYVIQSDQIL
jgi:hypothetical protein